MSDQIASGARESFGGKTWRATQANGNVRRRDEYWKRNPANSHERQGKEEIKC